MPDAETDGHLDCWFCYNSCPTTSKPKRAVRNEPTMPAAARVTCSTRPKIPCQFCANQGARPAGGRGKVEHSMALQRHIKDHYNVAEEVSETTISMHIIEIVVSDAVDGVLAANIGRRLAPRTPWKPKETRTACSLPTWSSLAVTVLTGARGRPLPTFSSVSHRLTKGTWTKRRTSKHMWTNGSFKNLKADGDMAHTAKSQ